MSNTAEKANSGSGQISFNSTKFDFQCVFANTYGRVNIPASLIDRFIVNDCIYSIFPEAELVIDNTDDQLDNFIVKTMGENPELAKDVVASDTKAVPQFQFNTDGYDSVIITMIPTFVMGCAKEELYRQDYFFIIVDENTEIVTDNNKKLKKFILKDIRQHVLETTNSRWSTADALQRKYKKQKINVNLNHVGNTGRKLETGLAIKDLLAHGLNNLRPGYAKFNDDWSTGEVKVFYSSKNNTSYMDDLEYLLDNHISEIDRDNCFLKASRDGSFYLKSVTEIFDTVVNKGKDKKLYGSGLQDIFHISGTVATQDSPGSDGGPDSNAAQQFDGIDSFHFMNMTANDIQNEMPSMCVHSYDQHHKQFSIDNTSAHIDNSSKESNQLYADPMAGHCIEPTAVIPTNESKKQSKTVKHVYVPGASDGERRKEGVNRILSNILTLAPCINFKTEGSAHRDAGKFIALANKKIEPESAAEKLIPGDWFVTNISHVYLFSESQYLNDITCVKPYTSQPLIKVEDGATDLPGAVSPDEGVAA